MKILIGIPSVRDYSDFICSMNDFLPKIGKEHEVDVYEVRGKLIDQARTEIVDYMLSKDFEYLLFLDDDHSGHTMEMFNALLELNTYVSAIKCYSRFFPYLPNLLDYSGIAADFAKYKTKDVSSGVHQFDLVGFGMTLIKREVFDILGKPYFIGQNNQREDNYFCDKLHEKGIKPLGIMDFTLTHQGIGEENVHAIKEEGMEKLKEQIRIQFKDADIQNITLIA